MSSPNYKFTTVSTSEDAVKIVSTPVAEKEYKSDTKFDPMLKFFKYEDGKFDLNKEELMLIPEARKIIYNDKGGKVKGDADGRNKLWAIKQFGVAWWLIDVNSPGIQSGLEGEELLKDALHSLDIEDWNMKEDKDFMNFLSVYKDMYSKAAYSMMLKQMLMSFKDSADIIKVIRDNTIKILKSNKDLDSEDIKILLSHQREIIGIAGDIPKQISKLKELQALVGREEREMETARGGDNITKSMVPNE